MGQHIQDSNMVCYVFQRCVSVDPLSAPEPLPSMVLGSAEAFIAVNGWLGQREDFIEPFQSLGLRQGTAPCITDLIPPRWKPPMPPNVACLLLLSFDYCTVLTSGLRDHQGSSHCLSVIFQHMILQLFHAGNTMALVWESRELMAVRTAFRRLLARSASIQTVQLALYATVSGMLCSKLLMYLIFLSPR